MARLHRVGRLRRGYRPRQVEAALAAVEQALAEGRPPSAGEVRRLGFDLVRHGYDVVAVDRALDRLELRCLERSMAGSPPWQVSDELARDLADLRVLLAGPPGARLPRAGLLRKGYAQHDVDALLDRLLDDLETASRALGSGASVVEPGLRVEEVRLAVFGRRRRGYAERGVDEVLDRAVDLLLRRDLLSLLLGAPVRTPEPLAEAEPSAVLGHDGSALGQTG
ncbi:DivIVA domain-containing protein [Motilibacter rhizosphaerae]|uniref:DivIVA domain-containing protein n=1 Tax=Motilibacter rhizosphaerae TaxID=598652 RepID=A0A4Q7NNZ7_9ACTN|nr:hypothetical protein [Motilibacter rhizosphaerae]RZS86969.1 DivIVA domain-containing protein [Motilibacter rhizosphaerae]